MVEMCWREIALCFTCVKHIRDFTGAKESRESRAAPDIYLRMEALALTLLVSSYLRGSFSSIHERCCTIATLI